MAFALRAAAACPGLDPGAFAFAVLQTQPGSALTRGPGMTKTKPSARIYPGVS